MKLLVTGVCGNLGKAVAKEASSQGMQVVGADIAPWPKDIELPANVTVHNVSYEDTQAMRSLLAGCDAVVHGAGLHGGHVATHSLEQYLEANIVSVARLLEAALDCGVKGINLASTMEVLIGRGWDTSGAAYLDENSRPQTDSAYSLSRVLVEDLAREFAYQSGLVTSCHRYCGFGYVPDNDLGPRLICRTLPAADVAHAAILAATNYDLRGDVFLITPRSPFTPVDMMQAFNDPQTVMEKYFPGACAILKKRDMELTPAKLWPMSDTRKAKLVLGWEPQLTFEIWLTNNGWQKPN
jgi:nucleoside-diphosphate-sugar epimerase